MNSEEYLQDIRAARKRIAALEASRAFSSTEGGALAGEINQEIDALQDKRREAFERINRLKDSRHVAVLVGYYIDGLTWQQVARVNGYSYSHVMHKIRPAALAALEREIDQ